MNTDQLIWSPRSIEDDEIEHCLIWPEQALAWARARPKPSTGPSPLKPGPSQGFQARPSPTHQRLKQGVCIQQAKVGVYQVSFSPLPSLGFLLFSNHLFRGSGNLKPTIHLHRKADPFRSASNARRGRVSRIVKTKRSNLLRLRRVNSVRFERNGNDRGDALCVTPKTVLTSRRIGIL